MSARFPGLAQQRGVAVITALLLTTLAITIVASLFWQQQVQVRSIENQRLQLQKQWILRGALDWAMLIVREDRKNSANDDLTEAWAVPLADTQLDQFVENARAAGESSDAVLSGHIIDAQSRFNLNNLAVNGVINPREVAAFGRLLVNVGLSPQLAQATADTIVATQPTPPPAPGAAAPTTAPGETATATSARMMPIEQVDDLLAVTGFSPDKLAKLRDFVIVLPHPTPINANTASAQVLSARLKGLSLPEAAILVAGRDKTVFRDAADLGARLATLGKPIAFGNDELEFSTLYFIVHGKVRINRAALSVQSLIERNIMGGVRIVAIQEN